MKHSVGSPLVKTSSLSFERTNVKYERKIFRENSTRIFYYFYPIYCRGWGEEDVLVATLFPYFDNSFRK